jgi:P27 family predicted phage terminase small subunit
MRGRPRKPIDQKIIQGTFRNDRTPVGVDVTESHAPVRPPRPPDYLNFEARKLWRQHVEQLAAWRMLETTDYKHLEFMCDAYGRFRELHDVIYCLVTDPATGKVRRRTMAEYLYGRSYRQCPELHAMRDAQQQYRQYSAEFPFSPLTRERIPMKKKNPDDADQLLMTELLGEGSGG